MHWCMHEQITLSEQWQSVTYAILHQTKCTANVSSSQHSIMEQLQGLLLLTPPAFVSMLLDLSEQSVNDWQLKLSFWFQLLTKVSNGSI